MKNPIRIFQKIPEEKKDSDVKLVVTGVCTPEAKLKLERDLKKKGVKAVVTSEPVFGVFDL